MLRTLAGLAGGLCFALAWLPPPAVLLNRRIPTAVLCSAVFTVLGFAVMSVPGLCPSMVVESGFTALARNLNTAGGLLFLAGAAWFAREFVRRSRYEDYLIFLTAVFNAGSGLLFGTSALWSGEWWLWHLLRFVSGFVLLGLVMASYRQVVAGLHDAQEELFAIFRDNPTAMIVVDGERRVKIANAAAIDLTGKPTAEVFGLRAGSALGCLHALDDPRGCGFGPFCQTCPVRNAVLDTFADGAPRRRVEAVLPLAQGGVSMDHCLLVSTASIRVAGGPMVVVCLDDVTERRRMSREIKESETRFRSLFENAQIGMYRAKLDGSALLEVNGKFGEILGFEQGELIGTPSRIRWADPDDRDRMLAMLSAQGGTLSGFEMRVVAKDGGIREVLSSITFDTENGVLEGTMMDVTDRKLAQEEKGKLEEQLWQSQKMEAVGKLAGGIAHDFNNLLSVVLSNCGFVLDDLPAESAARPDVLEIQKAARRAADLTRQLLAFSRRSIIQPQVLRVNDVIAGMEKLLKRTLGEDIVLQVLATAGLPAVKVDRGQLEQVIMNVAVNSRDAMPRGGRLVVETSAIRLDEEYVKTHAEAVAGNYVLLAVSDTGCGMPKEVVERALEPFFTTKEVGKGTGLGLSTVYGIVKQAGGHVGIYSVEGQGTTMKVYLPAVPESETDDGEGPVEAVASHRGRGETVFLVEDEGPVRSVAHRILERGGYRVVEASGGARALEIYEEFKGKFDLLLTDVVMPGMSGRETAEKLKAMGCAARVVFMSGYTSNIIAHHGVLDENTEFLFKPFSEESLLKKVREVLDKE